MPGRAAEYAAAPSRRVLVPPVSGPLLRPAGSLVRVLAGDTMGTSWSVRFAGRPDLADETVRAAVEAAHARVIAAMSGWNPGSDLSRYNRAEPGTWHELPGVFRTVLETALRIAEASGGAFNPTIGRLTDLWGFGPAGAVSGFPAAVDLEQPRRDAEWRRLRMDGARLLQPGGLALDLSGIAKGYAVDLVAASLRDLGLASFLVEIGGELRGEGVKPDLSPWWVALEHPPGADALPETLVALHGLSVATSGDYRRFRDTGSGRMAHTIDPRTGHPTRSPLVSVSVLAAECIEADAWATALIVLGPEGGLEAAERHGLAAHLVVREGDGFRELCSPSLLALAG